MTVLKEWLSAARQRLTEAGQDDADSTLEWWAAHLLGCNRPTVRIRSATCELSLDLEARLEAGLTRLAAGEPLQYVTGETSFFGRPFRCDPRALIPRPETEELVDRALQELRTARFAHRPPRVLDIGTGTGCIAVTIKLECPACEVTAVDLSEAALGLARENAERLGARVDFRLGDLLAGFDVASEGGFDLIVSNPPYVSIRDWEGLEPTVRDHEPRLALQAGMDGLDVYRQLLPQAAKALVPGGALWLEHSHLQADELQALARMVGLTEVKTETDLAGQTRFLYGRRHAAPD